MNFFKSFIREAHFMHHNRSMTVALICAFALSSLSIIGGLLEFERQQSTIANIKVADHQDRSFVLSEQENWGSAAYYGFHLTYDPPDSFAFAAMGQRDTHPWKHRIRMLALEGQIYERDTNNPIIALIGRFDFSFFVAFVLPFFMIVSLHDMRSSERRDGRIHLLLATAGSNSNLWVLRTFVISLSLFVCVVLPLILGSLINDVKTTIILSAVLYLAVYVCFWSMISYWFASWNKSSSVILAYMITLWLMVAVIIPTAGRIIIDRFIPVPSGAEILMMQRESVNDAWDIPKQDTMNIFVERYPEWSKHVSINRPFEWKWYFAFQEVGDMKTEKLSKAFRQGRLERDRLASYLSLLAPPALLERSLQKLAKTDTESNLAYEQKVRDFHAQLRQFYYPKLFEALPFDQEKLSEIPDYSPL